MDDKEMLEDLVAAAVNDAMRKVESTTHKKNVRFTRWPEPAAGPETAVSPWPAALRALYRCAGAAVCLPKPRRMPHEKPAQS